MRLFAPDSQGPPPIQTAFRCDRAQNRLGQSPPHPQISLMTIRERTPSLILPTHRPSRSFGTDGGCWLKCHHRHSGPIPAPVWRPWHQSRRCVFLPTQKQFLSFCWQLNKAHRSATRKPDPYFPSHFGNMIKWPQSDRRFLNQSPICPGQHNLNKRRLALLGSNDKIGRMSGTCLPAFNERDCEKHVGARSTSAATPRCQRWRKLVKRDRRRVYDT